MINSNIRGDMRSTISQMRISDRVLSFLVNYDYFVYKGMSKEEAMEKLRSKTEVENG